ncbi:MAG: rhodoquinone biosynthesis methyltransferase RquA [Wenzhouxiangella sp.]
MNESPGMELTGTTGTREPPRDQSDPHSATLRPARPPAAESPGEAPSKTGEDVEQLPDYLVRYYRWAYVWPFAVWFFDHQPIINAILFGNYRRIMNETLRLIDPDRAGRTLQVAAVYGELTPTLASRIDDLHLVDVASVQLRAARRKLDARGLDATIERMDAEALKHADDSFDTVVVFLLLHEMPPEVRRNTLREAARVLRPGGRLVIAEYGEDAGRHFLHKFWPTRWLLTTSEHFLRSFWDTDFSQLLAESTARAGKNAELLEQVEIFGGFYRAMSYRLS